MPTITIPPTLDVLSKYNSLIADSLGANSVYIRTKETVQEFFEQGNLKDTDKAQIISTVLSSLNTSLVNASMSTALQWAETEKATELKNLELALELEGLQQDVEIKKLQVKSTYYDNIAKQASTIRNYGNPVLNVDGSVASLDNSGKIYEDILLTQQTTTNKVKELDLLKAKEKETFAGTHKIVADTYNNFGKYDYTIESTGLFTVNDTTPSTFTTLSDAQRVVAQEQAKGYAYNAWSNTLVASSSTLGAAIASDTVGAAELTAWLTRVDGIYAKFDAVHAPSF